MRLIFSWSLAIGVIWLAAVGTTTGILAAGYPDSGHAIKTLNDALIAGGKGLGEFLAGPLTLAIVLQILVSVAERAGYKINAGLESISLGSNVQAILAIVIVLSFAIAALGSVGQVAALKDIALVVVGFYFGDRKRSGEIADIATAAVAAAGGPTKPPISPTPLITPETPLTE